MREMAKSGQKFAKLVSDDCGALVSVGVDGKRASIDPITITTLITTLLPMIAQWFQACREKRQQRQQDQTPQAQVSAAHADPKARAKNVDSLARKILLECSRKRGEEIRNAKKTGLPADVGRYEMDAASAYRLADKMHTRFATAKASDADALCGEYGVT
jgi:hypothetical protein